MAIPDKRLVKFCQRALGEVTERGSVSRVELYHSIGAGEGRELIDSIDIPEEADPEEFAQGLYDNALSHAETMPGTVQRYSALAYLGDEERHAYLTSFICNSRGLQMEGEEHSEPPTMKGTLAHFMRHNENQHKLLVGSFSEIVNSLKGSLREETHRRTELEALAMRTFTLNQQLLDRSQERELERAKEEARQERMNEMLKMAMGVVPLILQKLAAPTPTAQMSGGLTPLEKATAEAFTNMTPEEQAAFMTTLQGASPETRERFMNIYAAFQSVEMPAEEKH